MPRPIRAALLSYPMLLQFSGGLQIQMLQTLEGLKSQGVDARLFDNNREKLTDYDVVHVFAAINGNHRIIEYANKMGVPSVLSSVLHPPWTATDRRITEILSRVIGRLTSYKVTTSFDQIRSSLCGASRVIALGEAEKDMIAQNYDVDGSKIEIVPNGVNRAFFEADRDLFRQRFDIQGPYALITAYVSHYKGQLEAVRALRDVMPLMIVGRCSSENDAYLKQVLDEGGDQVRYIGELDNTDPVFASAYAGADLFILPSRSEVYPISAIEALAAGTPVVLTRENSLQLDHGRNCIQEVDVGDPSMVRQAVELAVNDRPTADSCRAIVSHLSWDQVALTIRGIYEELCDARD